jgi:hypothetical protein
MTWLSACIRPLDTEGPLVARIYASYLNFTAEIEPWLEISTPSNAPSGDGR